MSDACRFGRIEYDGARYCHEHGGFLEPGVRSLRCNRAPIPVWRQETSDE